MNDIKKEHALTGLEIAVIGMSMRFPGARDKYEFRENLKNGIESIAFFSNKELEEVGIPGEMLENPHYVKTNADLEDIEYFDAHFFGYTSRDARLMAPQVRLFHEYAWEALEDAGYVPHNYTGLIGVYAGASDDLTWKAKTLLGKVNSSDPLSLTVLNNKDFLSLRVSYCLNLKGPSTTINTSCSTSLAAIHMACRGLLAGECDMAIAGGISISIPRKKGYLFQEGMIYSRDGHVRPFDAKASGTLFGSGIGIVVLKSLEDAINDRDHIYAVVKGSAVNNDGDRKVGFTAPSVKGQAEVIKMAHLASMIEPESISYIEAHGTGTILGDPIEVKALAQAFNTDKKNFCAIGSVKANVGHLVIAAGAAGFIKAVLALNSRLIPPALHFTTNNPEIDFENSPFYINTQLLEWKNDEYPLRAGVSSFGIGGTNAHVVLEEYPGGLSSNARDMENGARGQSRDGISPPYPSGDYQLILLSAKTRLALDKMTVNLGRYLEKNPGINLADTAYTLAVGRKHWSHRQVLICSDTIELNEAFSRGASGNIQRFTIEKEKLPVVFMFPGQGAQYVNMGLELYEKEPLFREELNRCFDILSTLMDPGIKKILYPTATSNPHLSPDINQTAITQPLLFAIEYALAKLLMKWGIKPWAMIGHSIGEYVAAHLAGVFSLEHALKLVVLRGQFMQQMPPGSMLIVQLSEEELKPLLTGEIELAAVNGPALCAVSGTKPAIELLEKELSSKGIDWRRLHTSHAFHSKMMDPIITPFKKRIKESNICFNHPKAQYISNLTGKWIKMGNTPDPEYWATHLRQAVRFNEGIVELLKQEHLVFIETGPGNGLSTLLRKNPKKKKKQQVINMMRHPHEDISDIKYLREKVGQLWLYGGPVNWKEVYSHENTHRLPLPTYPFERQRHWIDTPTNSRDTRGHRPKSPGNKKRPISEWFYIPKWKSSAIIKNDGAFPGNTPAPDVWLLFIDSCGLGSALVTRLKKEQKTGKQVIVSVKPGSHFLIVSDTEYEINPHKPTDYSTLFNQLKTADRIPNRIIHLWNVTGSDDQLEIKSEGFEKRQQLGFYSLLDIVSTLGKLSISHPLRLAVVSDSMQPVTGEEEICPVKALLLGAVKVIPKEYSNIICQSIDVVLPRQGNPGQQRLVKQLLGEFTGKNLDSMVAYRGKERLIQGYEPITPGQPSQNKKKLRLRKNGVYLVTGGLGGIGWTFSEYLVKTNQARIIIVARTGLPPRHEWSGYLEREHHESEIDADIRSKIEKVIGLEKLGGKVLLYSADVAELARMKEVLHQVKQEFGKINGIIHAAGVADYAGVIQKRSHQVTAGVMAPKVNGTLILERLFQDKKLDFFILCSSLSSVLGDFGAVGYSAANAFMDAFAHYKASLGDTFTTAINWDVWQEVGMAQESLKRRSGTRREKGYKQVLAAGISPREGIEALERVLGFKQFLPQVVTSTTDLEFRLKPPPVPPKPQQQIPFIEPSSPTKVLPGEVKSPPVLYQRPELSTAYTPPNSDVEIILSKIWLEHLELEKIGIHDNFFELGANSLDIMNVNNRLKKAFNKDIPIVTLYTYPTIAQLRDYLSVEGTGIRFSKEELQRLRLKFRDGEASSGQERQEEAVVIGMACRFPGARTTDQFWDNLKNGIESISFFTNKELRAEGISRGVLNNPRYIKARGIIENIENFDAVFFGYKPREASTLDPQIRLFQECAWEALEISGYAGTASKLSVGIYAGASDNSQWRTRVVLSRAGFSESLLSMKDILCTQTSYKLDLKGPSLSLQTACSTSLLAIHLACKGLMERECDLALAGGVSITSPGKNGYMYEEGMIYSADGHIRPFDANATGTLFSHGAGVVVLKRLKDARIDGDAIYAVVKGSSVNNDGGRKVGFTAPSTKGQAEVIGAAIQAAGVAPESINYVETHGTGTNVGDPIEVEALKLAFNTGKKQYCALGSVKSNIGHLDAAAGVASFIKAVLALTHGQIPPTLHYKTPNPKINFSDTPFFVNEALVEWKNNGEPRRAGVSSFGFGGTNVHVILEEVPAGEPVAGKIKGQPPGKYQLIPLSAKSETALEAAGQRLAHHLKKNPGTSLADMAYTLQVGRKNFEYRDLLVCSTIDEAIDRLPGKNSTALQTFYADRGDQPVVFMFPGQGAQYAGMGWELYQKEPLFRREMDRCFELLKPIMGYDLKEILYPRDSLSESSEVNSSDKAHISKINQTEIAQPLLFIFEYALATLVIDWGIHPGFMIGHSIGEYCAACWSGVLTLEDALQLVVERGRLMQQMPRGAMLSIPLSEKELTPLLNGQVELAAVNSPSLCVVTGTNEAVEAFAGKLNSQGLDTTRLHTSHAFHSQAMNPILPLFEEKVKKITCNAPRIPYISNVTGQFITFEQVSDPTYWKRHIREPVRFSEGIKELLEKDKGIFIEIGPGRSLSTFVKKHIPGPGNNEALDKCLTLGLVRHPKENIPDDVFLLEKIARLWLYGKSPNWEKFHQNEKRCRIPLPTYPFEGKRYWLEQPVAGRSKKQEEQIPPRKKDNIKDWFYIPSWKPSPLLSSQTRGKKFPDCLLLFRENQETDPGSHLGLRLKERIQQEDIELVEVKKGTQFKEENLHYTINPGQEHDFEKLMADLRAKGRTPRCILYAWSTTGTDPGQPGEDVIEKALEINYYCLLFLARAIGMQYIEDPIQMIIISAQMQDAPGENLLAPHKAVLLGPVLVIPREYTNIRCRSIDVILPGSRTREEKKLVDQLMLEIKADSTDNIVAYRQHRRWVRSFEAVGLESPEEQSLPLQERGVYLITGGLGGIGMVLAEYLARQVKAKLVLIGRSAFPPREEWSHWLETHPPEDTVSSRIQKIRQLEAWGADVLVASADVSNRRQMEQTIALTEEAFGSIKGVIHSAGIPDAGLIPVRTRETSEKVFAAKIMGTLVLDSILKEQDRKKHLDFMVLCSSIAAVVAAIGQVGYVSANAFLDAFARSRRSLDDTTVISINWDTWQEVGMAVNAQKQFEGAFKISTKTAILPVEGQDIFKRVLGESFSQVITSTRDLEPRIAEARKVDSISIGSPAPGTSPTPKHRRPHLKTRYSKPINELEIAITRVWEELLGIDMVGSDDNFFDLGATSLDILQANRQLKEKLKRDIPVVALYNYPTVAGLAAYLGGNDTKEESIAAERQLHQDIHKGKNKLKQRAKRMEEK